MTAFVDTNVLVRHLTGDPPDLAQRATAFLGSQRGLLLTDLVAAETVYVLESFYKASRHEIAQAVRSLVAFESVVCVDPALLLRAIEVFEIDRIDFAAAYLVACAESTGVGRVASFDQTIDRLDRSSASSLRRSELCHQVRAQRRRRAQSPGLHRGPRRRASDDHHTAVGRPAPSVVETTLRVSKPRGQPEHALRRVR